MKNNKLRIAAIFVTAFFSVVMLIFVITMTMKSTSDLNGILADSVKSQLISVSLAAREIINPAELENYNTKADINNAYTETLSKLRALQQNAGTEYIYVLRHINGKYYFIFDTDENPGTNAAFKEYNISPVHEHAFAGKESADVMNVSDEYGNYNTGAVPVWNNGKLAGIISTDIADIYISDSRAAAKANSVSLIVSVAAVTGVMTAAMIFLTRHIFKIQEELRCTANYDMLTGLPNRQYLMEYLSDITKLGKPFVLLFVDLDNFKSVNDSAGHEMGDDLLRRVAVYLDNGVTKAFRPSAGMLNVSARIGGDEFLQIVTGVENEEEAAAAAQKVLDNFRSRALSHYIENYDIGLSIGAALFPRHTSDCAD